MTSDMVSHSEAEVYECVCDTFGTVNFLPSETRMITPAIAAGPRQRAELPRCPKDKQRRGHNNDANICWLEMRMELQKHSAAHSSRSAAHCFYLRLPISSQTGSLQKQPCPLFLWDCARGGQSAVREYIYRVHPELMSTAAVGLLMRNSAQLFKGQTGSCCYQMGPHDEKNLIPIQASLPSLIHYKAIGIVHFISFSSSSSLFTAAFVTPFISPSSLSYPHSRPSVLPLCS